MTGFYPEDDDGNNTLTFRIQCDIIDGLLQGSIHKSDENVESLINQKLRSFVTWHNPSQAGGNIPFSKWLILRIFNNLNDEQMDKIAQEFVEYDLKDQMHMSGLQYNMLSCLDFACSWCEASGFTYRHDRDNAIDRYVFRFDLGKNWPVFFAKFIQKISKYLGEEKNLEIEVINNTLIVNIQR